MTVSLAFHYGRNVNLQDETDLVMIGTKQLLNIVWERILMSLHDLYRASQKLPDANKHLPCIRTPPISRSWRPKALARLLQWHVADRNRLKSAGGIRKEFNEKRQR